MGKLKNIKGNKYERLTVLELTETINGFAYWLCVCDCEEKNKIIVRGSHLRSGSIKSCGCLLKEHLQNKNIENTKHGQHNTRLYHIWNDMKKRCLNNNASNYKDYGGRGITVCEDWKNSFESFFDWSIKNGYNENLTIERINNNGNYEQSNCRWATHIEQQNNKRDNRVINYLDVCYTIAEAAQHFNIKEYVLRDRIQRGWSVERALTTSVKPKNKKLKGE